MIRFTETPTNIINLDGPDGNTNILLGEAMRLAKEMGYAHDDIQSLTDTMTKSDYTNLVKTFDNHFGDFVILETTNEDLLNAKS